jgi:triacylglycerol esterase/lipase EstA (alpha/beta hydrolase family)
MRIRLGWLCALGAACLGGATVDAASSFPAHRGTSPWSFTSVAEPSSRFIVNDTDSATIDVYLLRSQGPIVIDVKTRRYIGPTDAQGYLLNVAQLRARGIVGSHATITLPAYDVDETTPPNTDCDGDGTVDHLASEIDDLYLNGSKIGTLTGSNNRWLQNSFTVPIDKLKFPGQPGQTATNQFRLDIDVGNRDVILSSGAVGCDRWAVTIDWIGVQYEASSPVVMVHGIASSGDTFGNFQIGLERASVMANDASITLSDPPAPDPIPAGCPDIAYNKSIQFNVAQLSRLVPRIAEQLGSETLHFVAHSKGGLDVRGFLSNTRLKSVPVKVGTMGGQPVIRDLESRSLITLGTPHGGSVLAQYGVEARQLTTLQALRADLNVAAAKSYEGAYYCDLTPDRAHAFVGSTSLPNTVQRASIASNADCNGDQKIDATTSCGSSRSESESFSGGALAANRLYQLLGTISDVTIAVTARQFLPDKISIVTSLTTSFQVSDAIVSRTSAWLYRRFPITGWNHQNIHSRENAEAIATDALNEGFVSWRRR